MNKQDNIISLFQHNADNRCPAIYKYRIQNEPKLEYQQKLITPSNIEQYRSNITNWPAGVYVPERNKIIVYRYNLDSALVLNKNDSVLRKISCLIKEEPRVIKHELKHFENNKQDLHCINLQNYYEMSALQGFDEVSAYSAEYIDNNSAITYEDVCSAVDSGINDFVLRKSHYVPEHIQWSRDMLEAYCLNLDYLSKKHHIERYLTPVYSDGFYKIVTKYLTFRNQCLFAKRRTVPQQLQQKLCQICTVYEQATNQMLKSVLSNHKRHI